jgi:hypothetical protein
MTARTDPRERVLVLGNEIINAIYKIEVGAPRELAIAASVDDGSATEMDDVFFLIERLTLLHLRDEKIAAYVAVRSALDGGVLS